MCTMSVNLSASKKCLTPIHILSGWNLCVFGLCWARGKKFLTSSDAVLMSGIWYFGFSAAGTIQPASSPDRVESGWMEEGEGQGEEERGVGGGWGFCPEKHTPSSGCLHLFGMSVVVSMVTRVKIVGMCQRYSAPSGADCWTWVEEWTGYTGSGRGWRLLSIILDWTCGRNQRWLQDKSSVFNHWLLCLPFTLTGKAALGIILMPKQICVIRVNDRALLQRPVYLLTGCCTFYSMIFLY